MLSVPGSLHLPVPALAVGQLLLRDRVDAIVQETRRQGAARERACITRDAITRRAALAPNELCRKRVFPMNLFCTAAG